MPENAGMSTDWKIAVVLYALEKHGPRALGVTRTYAYLLRRGKRRPSDELVRRALSLITAEELLALATRLKGVEVINGEPKDAHRASGPSSSLVRTPPLQGGGPGFKSPRPHHAPHAYTCASP